MQPISAAIANLQNTYFAQSAAERLASLRRAVPGRIVFTTSLGLEDQVITHLIATAALDVDIVTLDTGRLFPQTYQVWAETEKRYGIRIHAMFPNPAGLTDYHRMHGVNAFYDSAPLRHACCRVRKLEPLSHALDGAAAWIVGLRADASANRAAMQPVEWDDQRGLVKYSPLFDWTRDDVARTAAREDIPVNTLHAKGFVSIGCAPCTRAIGPDEPERAGRWWWEQADLRECGLHVDEDGRVRRPEQFERGAGI